MALFLWNFVLRECTPSGQLCPQSLPRTVNDNSRNLGNGKGLGRKHVLLLFIAGPSFPSLFFLSFFSGKRINVLSSNEGKQDSWTKQEEEFIQDIFLPEIHLVLNAWWESSLASSWLSRQFWTGKGTYFIDKYNQKLYYFCQKKEGQFFVACFKLMLPRSLEQNTNHGKKVKEEIV